MSSNTSDILIRVHLDDDKIPEKITWKATDNAMSEMQEIKALLLSLFEPDHKDTLRIDLWTKDMEVGEMDRLFYNTLKSFADTYMRATGNKQLAGTMQQFAKYFGEQTQILQSPPEVE